MLGRLRAGFASIAIAALLIGVSVGAACWAVESAVISSQRTDRLKEVRDTLARARVLLGDRQQAAAHTASRLAASTRVQGAFANRDAAALARIAHPRPGVGFVLWDGRTVGHPQVPGLGVGVAVYVRGALAGRVAVSAEPDDALLARARRSAAATHLVFTVAGRISAASPSTGGGSLVHLLRHTVNDDVALNVDAQSPARLTGFRARPAILLRGLWPWVFGPLAALLAFRIFQRREARHRAEPPPNTVRDAVALVGETLAATHNPDALMPVILQAAVEATDAVGGTIRAGGAMLATRGHVDARSSKALDVALEIPEGSPATMTLYPPVADFSAEARDAAAWIAAQAVIALENARLHGLVQRQAVTDELTGLANRRRFVSQLELEVTRSRRSGSPLGIVLADLDDFKRVNDAYGHDVGDEALRGFADVLRATVRDIDLPVRLGGEEFAVLLPDTDLAGGAQLAERIRHALETTAIEGPKGQIRLTASFGVSCFPAAVAADDLLTDADRRLYDAKRRGKNRVVASRPQGTNPSVR